ARAYCCAEEQGKASAMADALFTAPSLTKDGCAQTAAAIGLTMPAYERCVVSPATDQRIDDQVKQVRIAGLRGLPTVWIGERVIGGPAPPEPIRDAFADAARGGHPLRIAPVWLWSGFALVLACFAVVAHRRSGAS